MFARISARPQSCIGFTLTEILMSVTIFMIVGGAMVGIFATSVELFRSGEAARSANDEAMAVIGMLDRDIKRAIPANRGGRIYARAGTMDPDEDDPGSYEWELHGFDVFGLLIANNENNYQRDFVVWIAEGDGPVRRLERRVFYDVNDAILNSTFFSYISDPRNPNDWESEQWGGGDTLPDYTRSVVTGGLLHFGVWLAETDDYRIQEDMLQGPHNEGEKRFWLRSDPIIVHAGINDFRGQRYTSFPTTDGSPTPRHPRALRITMAFTGDRHPRPSLRLRDAIDDDTDRIRLVGPGAVPSGKGSIARIGDELIGFHSSGDGKVLRVNANFNDGPVRLLWEGNPPSTPIMGNGRGIYHSLPREHSRGSNVYFGQQFSLVRVLP
ncbi:MAG: hypothetical protein EA401_01760 [Planctomycetota bacterium]|nr:MAG: hypothetical protein EA401_01760 [Planctomycetota bacterium]